MGPISGRMKASCENNKFTTKESANGQQHCSTTGEQQQQQQSKNKTTRTQEQLSSPLSQVLKTYDFGNSENCELQE